MPRGSKTIKNTTGHRTKAEKESREKAETAMQTGTPCRMSKTVESDETAKAEFERLTALLKVIGKDDALYEAQVNRYCELKSEIVSAQEMYKRLEAMAENDDEALLRLAPRLDKIDATIMQKRKMMYDIEKENGWTAQSALRVIPKKAEKESDDELLKALQE